MIRIIIICSNDNSNPLSKPHRGWFLDIVQRRSRCFQIVPFLAQDWPAIVLIIVIMLILMSEDYSFNLEKRYGNIKLVPLLVQDWPANVLIIADFVIIVTISILMSEDYSFNLEKNIGTSNLFSLCPRFGRHSSRLSSLLLFKLLSVILILMS